MLKIKASDSYVLYRGCWFRTLFGESDWVALHTDNGTEVPDAFERGQRHRPHEAAEQWAKIPIALVEETIDVRVWGMLRGASVLVRSQSPEGRVMVEFTGDPETAKLIGLDGDQHMGWSGWVEPTDLMDIQVEETRRA